MRHNDGNWAGYTYEWNAGGTDATRVIGGKTVQVAGQTWEFPSEAQCLQCHIGCRRAARSGSRSASSTATSVIRHRPHGQPAHHAECHRYADARADAAAGAAAGDPRSVRQRGARVRARAPIYIPIARNCHRPRRPAPSNLDFRYTTALASTNACDIAPTLGNLGITNARLIAPGSAARSVVVARVNRVGTDAMPPLSRHTIDTAGVQLLTSWVNGLANCN